MNQQPQLLSEMYAAYPIIPGNEQAVALCLIMMKSLECDYRDTARRIKYLELFGMTNMAKVLRLSLDQVIEELTLYSLMIEQYLVIPQPVVQPETTQV